MVKFKIQKRSGKYNLYYKDAFTSYYRMYIDRGTCRYAWDSVEECKEQAKKVLEECIRKSGVLVEEFEL